MQTSLRLEFPVTPPLRFFCVICGTALETSADSHHDLLECHSCTCCVPVPRPASLMGRFLNCQPVLPSRVLELSVTFHCTACQSRLRTDARLEGREITCPDCGHETGVPRWSTVPSWLPPAVAEKPRARTPPPRIRAEAAVLSAAEIEFLRGPASESPGAAA